MRSYLNLDRFLVAQQPVWAQVIDELSEGRKRSHWMWFVFPQIHGLGHSEMAERYAIQSRTEAEAYLAHPVLGARLRRCCCLLLEQTSSSPYEVFGTPDDLKLHSCLTLFNEVAGQSDVFEELLEKYFDGKRDIETLRILV